MEGLNVKALKKGKRVKKEANISLNWLTKDIQLFRNTLNNRKKEAFYIETSSMLAAGMDLKYVLDMLIDQKVKTREVDIYMRIRDDLVLGSSFSEAMERTGLFTPYEYFSVKIGEESGQLIKVLEQLAEYYGKRIKQGRQLISSLSYPIVVLLSSILAVIFMLTFIVPMFTNVFSRFGGELPKLTRILINLSDMIRYNFHYILLPAILVTVVLIIFWKNPKFRSMRQVFFTRIPVMGNLYLSVFLARFCTSMALLTAAKVPLLQALELIKQMVDFQPIRVPVEHIEKDIMNGITLNESMAAYKVFDKKMIALVKVGEEVNRLDFFFDKLSKRFSDEVELKTSVINTFLEPLIIVFLGLVVGTILIAMYLPMFKLSTSIG